MLQNMQNKSSGLRLDCQFFNGFQSITGITFLHIAFVNGKQWIIESVIKSKRSYKTPRFESCRRYITQPISKSNKVGFHFDPQENIICYLSEILRIQLGNIYQQYNEQASRGIFVKDQQLLEVTELLKMKFDMIKDETKNRLRRQPGSRRKTQSRANPIDRKLMHQKYLRS